MHENFSRFRAELDRQIPADTRIATWPVKANATEDTGNLRWQTDGSAFQPDPGLYLATASIQVHEPDGVSRVWIKKKTAAGDEIDLASGKSSGQHPIVDLTGVAHIDAGDQIYVRVEVGTHTLGQYSQFAIVRLG